MKVSILGANIRRYLSMFDMTQSELADTLGVANASVTNWINGKFYPRLVYLEAMADLFHCSTSDLMEENLEEVKAYKLTVEEYLVVLSFRDSDEIQREMVKRLLNYSAKLKEMEKGVR